MRNQDWVIKIDYADGSGTGNILWRLGRDGDFTIDSTDLYPWFSHQHEVSYELNGTQKLSLFDNGNTRAAQNPGIENSRGQVLNIDEGNRVVTLSLNADLGVFSPAGGSAQRLPNGNHHFTAGVLSGLNTRSIEVLPDGSHNLVVQTQANTYRDFRMTDLYTPPK
jgi:hypothetical protein